MIYRLCTVDFGDSFYKVYHSEEVECSYTDICNRVKSMAEDKMKCVLDEYHYPIFAVNAKKFKCHYIHNGSCAYITFMGRLIYSIEAHSIHIGFANDNYEYINYRRHTILIDSLSEDKVQFVVTTNKSDSPSIRVDEEELSYYKDTNEVAIGNVYSKYIDYILESIDNLYRLKELPPIITYSDKKAFIRRYY